MAPPPIPKKGRLRFFLHPRHWHRWLSVGVLRVISLLPLPMLAWGGGSLGASGRLADLTDAAVLPFFTRLLPAGRGYQVTLGAALEDFPTGDRDKDATRMNQVLEEGIRKMSAQYMWTLKLFKTRPDNGPSPYS